MNKPLFYLFALSTALSLSAISHAEWIFSRRDTAAKAQVQMPGMSEEEVLECMGSPEREKKVGRTEVWSYASGGDANQVAVVSRTGRHSAAGVGKSMPRSCRVNVVFRAGKVQRLTYAGRTGGLLTGDEQCAFAVKNCVH